MEKHFVLAHTVLLSWQEKVLDELVKWVKWFSTVGRLVNIKIVELHTVHMY